MAGRSVLVLGLGASGRSAAGFCAARGADVVAADERPRSAFEGLEALGGDIRIACGGPLPDPADFDLVVPSPGVPRERYADRAHRAWGDVELAGRALAVPVVAVTGTNGKSTVTRLIEALLRAAGLRAEAAGNIGRPALELVGRPLDAAVLEVSSFQLEATEAFRPRVAVILNLSPDHLDRHGSLETYRDTKARILARQEPDDSAVLSREDPQVWPLAERTRARVLGFATRGPVSPGLWLDGHVAVVDLPERQRIPLDGVALDRRMDRENVAAALCAVLALGADLQLAVRALPHFEGLPHRCERVAVEGGITWVNDSKATNVGAARCSLESFPGPLVWIAGGRDKGLDFAPLAEAARGRVRLTLLIGESAPQLEAVLADVVACERVESLEAAVKRASQEARPGDVVLLAPGCASFDQFESFEQRGECFRAAALALGSVEGRA